MQNNVMFYAWKRCNAMMISLITQTLSPKITQSITYIENIDLFKSDHFIYIYIYIYSSSKINFIKQRKRKHFLI